MKGIAHFVSGVAIATFFPPVVSSAAAGSILPVLGGIAAILPDTLDFKFVRYFQNHDLEIDPGPDPDGQAIGSELAAVMQQAYETRQPQSVMLHTIRLGADLWRRYTLRFDPEHGQIGVRVGPVVDTGKNPLPGSAPDGAEEVRIPLDVPLADTYDREIDIDIFTGPSITFRRQHGQLHVHFLDWHRRWSHSLTLAAALGLGTAAVSGLVEHLVRGDVTQLPFWIGLVVGLGFVGHIVQDQLGHMGSNLLYPLTQDRTPGLGLLRSGDALPNFLTVWTALMLILFNLDRFSAQPRFPPGWFLSLVLILPIVILGAAYRHRRRRWSASTEALREQDILSEAAEAEMS